MLDVTDPKRNGFSRIPAISFSSLSQLFALKT